MRKRNDQGLVPTIAVIAIALLGAVSPGDRTPEAILAEIDEIPDSAKYPSGPDRELKALDDYQSKTKELRSRRSELILELYETQPDHPRLPELMAKRWSYLFEDPMNSVSLPNEIDDVLFNRKDKSLRSQGLYFKASIMIRDPARRQDALSVINLLLILQGGPGKANPQLLFALVSKLSLGSPPRAKVEERILREYPDSDDAKLVAGWQRRRAAMGKPFHLSFQDAISGSTVSTDQMRGKVVVIDFWATWCSPCVAEVPHLKDLYERYHSRGVEFIGVSLDNPVEQGGLEKLKTFVAKHAIPWPQYHQGGNGVLGNPEFSRSWGVYQIPTTLVLDAEGRLASDGSDGPLDKLIPEILTRPKSQVATKEPGSNQASKAKSSRGGRIVASQRP